MSLNWKSTLASVRALSKRERRANCVRGWPFSSWIRYALIACRGRSLILAMTAASSPVISTPRRWPVLFWTIQSAPSRISVFLSFRTSAGRCPIKELCRKGGFSDATFYKWRAKYGGMDAPDAKRLRELENEDAKLKKLLAEVHLDIHARNTAFGVKR